MSYYVRKVQKKPFFPFFKETDLLFNLCPIPFVFAQTCSQTELENWITAIHSACATAVARQHHREDTVRLLRAEIKKLEQKIDMDEKMKKMGDMQLSAVTDNKKRKTILDQVSSVSTCFAGYCQFAGLLSGICWTDLTSLKIGQNYIIFLNSCSLRQHKHVIV